MKLKDQIEFKDEHRSHNPTYTIIIGEKSNRREVAYMTTSGFRAALDYIAEFLDAMDNPQVAEGYTAERILEIRTQQARMAKNLLLNS